MLSSVGQNGVDSLLHRTRDEYGLAGRPANAAPFPPLPLQLSRRCDPVIRPWRRRETAAAAVGKGFAVMVASVDEAIAVRGRTRPCMDTGRTRVHTYADTTVQTLIRTCIRIPVLTRA